MVVKVRWIKLLTLAAFSLGWLSLQILMQPGSPFKAWLPIPWVQAATPQTVYQGTQIRINGKSWPGVWSGWPSDNPQQGFSSIGISDAHWSQLLGGDLLDTEVISRQPVQWFSNPEVDPLILAAWLTPTYRFLDISALARWANWQLSSQGNTLELITPPAQIQAIHQDPQGDRLTITLDRPTPWQMQERPQTTTVTLEAGIAPQILTAAAQGSVPSSTQPPWRLLPTSTLRRTQLQISQGGSGPLRAWTDTKPYRLIIEGQAETLAHHSIQWGPGLRWHQQGLSLGPNRFPVTWLEVNLTQPNLSLKPIWGGAPTLVGTEPLKTMARRWQAAAAINGGFFNRKNRLPLGAMRRDGHWLSGPILNRGAIAWDETGSTHLGRLQLQETLITPTGQRLPIDYLNSGYVQLGLARYTPAWGWSYTTLTDRETLLRVEGDRLSYQQTSGLAGQQAFAIPQDGYLLTWRGAAPTPSILDLDTALDLEQRVTPSTWEHYPNILAAGPLLMENQQIVLNPEVEQFNSIFARGKASRSAIARTSEGKLLLVTVHQRVGGRGPTLTELAQLLQKLGATDALNLDGGSSTGLYLGGQLIDRPDHAVARVHNGLGIFITP